MIPVIPLPDKALMDRLDRIVDEARERLGEERWKQLNDEWLGNHKGEENES